MLYNIQTKEHAYEFLSTVTDDSIEKLQRNWVACGESIDNFIDLYTSSINNWDIEATDFMIKHLTSSCCELRDVKSQGLLYLYDVIKNDTFLSRLLKKADFNIDVEAEKLYTAGSEYDLNWESLHSQPWTALFLDDLTQISRAIYRDYTSTFLHCSDPFSYGNGLSKHPEFMDYIARIPPNGKKVVRYWDEHSKGFLITARVPFNKVSHVTFGTEDISVFEADAKRRYIRSKKYLFHNACEIALEDFDSDHYLFIKRNARITPQEFICIEEHG